MKNIFISLFLLSLFQFVSAQNIVYTFDYRVDMEQEAKYTDTTQNYKSLESTFISSKNRTYVGNMLYSKDSTDNELTIMDFKNRKSYIVYPNAKEREIMIVNHENKELQTITEQKLDTTFFKRTLLTKKIGPYNCEELAFTTPDYSYETWYTKDIPDAPANAFYAIDMYSVLPPSYRGVPVYFRFKSKEIELSISLVSTRKLNYKIVLRANKLVQFDTLLKDITTPKKNE